jgi:tryptophan 2,3-dioxygenase
MKTANWWKFSIETKQRRAKIKGNDGGLREINPTEADGRRLIDYAEYLGLEKLLAAQVPASETPDERVFITTHHHFEIAFKQMIFDLAVCSESFRAVCVEASEDRFHFLCTSRRESEEFWRPAISAVNRLKYNAKVVLPIFFHFLDKDDGKDETFSSAEYFNFRPFLPPASGFQSAQFRLIQRAFGRGVLFQIRLFPSAEYRRDYEAQTAAPDLIEITNPIVLREETNVANPPETSPLFSAAAIDDAAHRVLDRLAQFADADADIPPIRMIAEREIETAVEAFRRILTLHRRDQEKIGEKPANAEEFDQLAVANFRADLEQVAAAENKRRTNLQRARAGAFYLRYIAPKGNLTHVLNRLISTDAALFGQQEDSFLSLHLKMATDRLRDVQKIARLTGKPEPPAGTGGGGVPYLTNIKNNLIPLFPFLVAALDLEDAPVFSWIE